jgi:hypothetical protein
MLLRQGLYLLSQTCSPAFCWELPRWGFVTYLPGLPSNHDRPELCVLSSKDISPDPPLPLYFGFDTGSCYVAQGITRHNR